MAVAAVEDKNGASLVGGGGEWACVRKKCESPNESRRGEQRVNSLFPGAYFGFFFSASDASLFPPTTCHNGQLHPSRRRTSEHPSAPKCWQRLAQCVIFIALHHLREFEASRYPPIHAIAASPFRAISRLVMVSIPSPPDMQLSRNVSTGSFC